MTWQAEGKYAIRCGEFVITKNSTADGWVFLCFKAKQLIGRAKDGDEARGICELHGAPRTERPRKARKATEAVKGGRDRAAGD